MKPLLGLLTLLALAGCATMPQGVMLVGHDQVTGCTPLGMVSNDAFHDMTLANATADMMSMAKEMGANRVVLHDQSAKMLEISMVGTAYSCNEY